MGEEIEDRKHDELKKVSHVKKNQWTFIEENDDRNHWTGQKCGCDATRIHFSHGKHDQRAKGDLGLEGLL